jgi:UDP-N-acetylmuramate--alanine ligase
MQKNHIHFVGIGGIGVSSLARYYLTKNWSVSGSDTNFVKDLQKEKIQISVGHDARNVPSYTKILVYSTATLSKNPEIKKAQKIGAKILSYPQALGEVTKTHKTIAVSGTHGKSTTTAMLSLILTRAGLDPTVIIGTKLKEFGETNFRKGDSKYLLIEADEFRAALLNYFPLIAVITNIEEDHLDFYKDINDIFATFKKYVQENLKKGTLVVNKEDNLALTLKDYARGKVVEFPCPEGKNIKLSVPGKHNIANAAAAFCVAKELGIESSIIHKALQDFQGSWRRFEEKNLVLKNKRKITVINDYAHHPTEIGATIQATQEKYPQKKIIAVFQPHQYERTYRLFSGFKNVLSSICVDKLLITDIYTVKGRESLEIIKKVSAKRLADEVKTAKYTGNLEDTASYLRSNLQGNEIVVIMGAGDVYKLEEDLVN